MSRAPDTHEGLWEVEAPPYTKVRWVLGQGGLTICSMRGYVGHKDLTSKEAGKGA